MFDMFLLVLFLALALICCVCFIAYKRKIERVEADVRTLQEREEMRTIPIYDSSISLKWGRKAIETTKLAPQLNTEALAQVLHDRLGATQASQLVRVLDTDPEQLQITQPSVLSLLSRKH